MKTNEELLDEFIEDVKIRGWSDWTIQSCELTINKFFDHISKSCLEVEMDDLKSFLIYFRKRPGRLGNKHVSSETIRKYFNNLASFFEYLEFEDYIVRSPIPKFRRRYLGKYTNNTNGTSARQIISIEQMSDLVNSILDPQDKAMVCTLAKTGVRVSELVAIDIDDINWSNYSIKLKTTGKRSNLIVYFDNETAKCLRRWINVRDEFTTKDVPTLFINSSTGNRITGAIACYTVKKYAAKIGIHDKDSKDLGKLFTPHCCRHWFTTHLRRARMPREFIKELRGDTRNETMDIYDHIDEEELRRSYLSHIPQLGI